MSLLSRSLRRWSPALCILLLPFAVRADVPAARAVSADALRASLSSDTQFESLPGGYALVVPEPFAPPITADDPIYRNHESRALFLYAPDIRGGLARRVVVHFDPDDRDSALKSARLIARLLRLQRERFQRELPFPRAEPVADVWFVPKKTGGADEGGETRDANIYVFAASSIQTPLELVRTIVHEWGHLTLPAARGYSEPENDAAGYLGERLHMKWLYEESHGGVVLPADGTAPADLALYYRRQVAPLIQRWTDGGPQSTILDEDRTEAMDYYIGGALSIDESFGSRILGKALFSIDDDRPRDLIRALETVTQEAMARGNGLSLKLPAWVPLTPSGRYTLSTPKGTGVIAISDRPPLPITAKNPIPIRILVPGWKWVHTVSGNLTTLTIKRQVESEASE